MNKQNLLNKLQEKVEAEQKRRDKKKKRAMKVSGAKVRDLQRIIQHK